MFHEGILIDSIGSTSFIDSHALLTFVKLMVISDVAIILSISTIGYELRAFSLYVDVLVARLTI